MISPWWGVARFDPSLRLRFREDAACDRQRRIRGGPARVESEMRDELDDLVLRDAVFERALQVERQLIRAVAGDERRHGDETAITRREAGAPPHVAEEH